MAITATSVKAIGGSAFSALDDDVVDFWIAAAEGSVSDVTFRAQVDNARTFWVLHHLSQAYLSGAGAGGAGGAITGMTVGQVSVSFASPGSSSTTGTSDRDLATTAWGRAYLGLRRQYASGGRHLNVVVPVSCE